MKKRLIIFALSMAIILPSCNNNNFEEDAMDQTKILEISKRANGNNEPIYSQDELIVQYLPGTSNSTKAMLRQTHGVFSFEVCQLCPDESIEKWFFNIVIMIEPKKKAIEDYGGLADVDYEFDFTSVLGDISPGGIEDLSYLPLIKPTNSGITIAVLDTGSDPFFLYCYEVDGVTPKPLLYNASETKVGPEFSGWDFVNYDHNAFDDHDGKHGSAINFIINDILNDAGVPHQFLPLKVCDNTGATSYFTLVCGLRYALERADVIQMSLGWYDDGFGDFENAIFNSLVSMHSDVLIVTSAGNDGFNNEDDIHYPSSYENNNIVAVASTNEMGTDIADFSNFGNISVDFFAQGEKVPFYGYDGLEIEGGLTGTSFAAPQIAAKGAQYMYENPSFPISGIINDIDVNALPITGDYLGMVQYDKYYPLLVD